MEFEKDEKGNDVIYEVDTILAKEVLDGKTVYFIRWHGYDDSWNTWEEASAMNCPEAIQEFEQRMEALRKQEMETKKRKEAAVEEDSDSDQDNEEKDKSFGTTRKSVNNGRHHRPREYSARKTCTRRSEGTLDRKRTKTLDSQGSSQDRVYTGRRSNPVKSRPDIRESRNTTSTTDTPMNGAIIENVKVKEIALDTDGVWIIHYYCLEESRSKMMYYSEFKEKYPNAIIDYFEEHLTFQVLGVVRKYQLVDPS